jgi:chromosome segregation ATPase
VLTVALFYIYLRVLSYQTPAQIDKKKKKINQSIQSINSIAVDELADKMREAARGYESVVRARERDVEDAQRATEAAGEERIKWRKDRAGLARRIEQLEDLVVAEHEKNAEAQAAFAAREAQIRASVSEAESLAARVAAERDAALGLLKELDEAERRKRHHHQKHDHPQRHERRAGEASASSSSSSSRRVAAN